MSKVVIFGVGQIAEIAHFYLTNDSEHEVVAFSVDNDFLANTSFHGLPVVPFHKLVKEYPPQKYDMFLPISYKKLNKFRAQKFFDVKKNGYKCISYVSSKATYYNTSIGENCFILENNVIQPFCEIGNNCILWSGNHIGHHTRIENHCFLASHVVVSGSVTIGEYSFIGVNATIRDNINIAKQSIVGAGALILSDTDYRGVFYQKNTEKSKVPSNRIKI